MFGPVQHRLANLTSPVVRAPDHVLVSPPGTREQFDPFDNSAKSNEDWNMESVESGAPIQSEGHLPSYSQMNASQTNIYAPTQNILFHQSVDPSVTELAQQTIQHSQAQAGAVVDAVRGQAAQAVNAAQAETHAQANRANYAEKVANDEHARRVQAEAEARAAEIEMRRIADAASAAQHQTQSINKELEDTRSRAHSIVSNAQSQTSAASSRALEAEARAARLEQEMQQLRELCQAQNAKIEESLNSSQRLEQEHAQIQTKYREARNQLRELSKNKDGPVAGARHSTDVTQAKSTDERDLRESARRRDLFSRDQRRASRHSSTFSSDSEDGRVRASRRSTVPLLPQAC